MISRITPRGIRMTKRACLQRPATAATISPRHFGPNINSVLKDELQTKTTSPPGAVSGRVIGDLVLDIDAPRTRADQLTRGFNYDPIDWLVSSLVVNDGTLLITNSAVVADYSCNGWYLVRINPGGTMISEGSAVGRNRIVCVRNVQENSVGEEHPYTLFMVCDDNV